MKRRKQRCALANSDPSQFVNLLFRHQDALLRHILPLVGCFDDAQDVLQETATAMWKKFAEYNTTRPFLPWAKQFARNEVLMHHRCGRNYSFLTEALVESLLVENQARQDESHRRQVALKQCLSKLPEAERRLINQRCATNTFSIRQLAHESGQSANVLHKSLARIRSQLMNYISRSLATEAT